MKAEAFGTAIESQWSILKSLRFKCGQLKMEAFENAYQTSIVFCRFNQRFRAF